LQWEKKMTLSGGSGAVELHDVDALYTWAGECSMEAKFCQPNAAATRLCRAQTDPAYWSYACEECLSQDGTCEVTSSPGAVVVTTVWDWISQLNETNFAGHANWRAPTSGGNALLDGRHPTGDAAELESILDLTQGSCAGGSGPCIDPIFGPTAPAPYCSG